MMALSKKMLEQEPSEIELLLPWHAAGTLNAHDARRVEEALAGDPQLAKQYAAIRGESFAKNSEIRAERLSEAEGLRAGSPSIAANSFCMARADGAPRLSLR